MHTSKSKGQKSGHAVTRIRTWVVTATTWSTNHYTITARNPAVLAAIFKHQYDASNHMNKTDIGGTSATFLLNFLFLSFVHRAYCTYGLSHRLLLYMYNVQVVEKKNKTNKHHQQQKSNDNMRKPRGMPCRLLSVTHCAFTRRPLNDAKITPNVGLEPTTLRLRVSCSTDWASRARPLINGLRSYTNIMSKLQLRKQVHGIRN